MTLDLFTPASLNRVVEEKINFRAPGGFFLQLFGRETIESQEETIYFDKVPNRPRITPFVSPMVQGHIVDDWGYETESFRPAYAKDKRVFIPGRTFRRRPGEAFMGSMTPAQRLAVQIGQALDDQLDMLDRREEVMVREALLNGTVTVSGEKYPTRVVNFGRHADLSKQLLTTARWGETDVEPFDDVEAWLQLVQDHSGTAPNLVLMDNKAWSLFNASPKVQKLLDIRRPNTSVTLDQGFAVTNPEGNKARFKGQIGTVEYWVYQDTYIDDDGNATQMMPDHTVIIGDPMAALGARCYGAIQDLAAQMMAMRYFTKSWEEEDPSVRYLLMQSAPLFVFFRPNATFRAYVR
jgi:hypothetical protein